MATIYICKCGRQVRKSTNADNTGNRDTAGCRGCPYLLPWGPTEWTGKGFEQNIQGHECRMSPEISYATDYSGSADDKRTMAIHSLDFDFLEEVQAWIDEYADGQLSGRFSRDTIRGTDYCNEGRYSWSISCAQNKKGMAAKGALIERFFGPDKHRLDKTPEEEKAHVLAAIEAGKAKASGKEKDMQVYTNQYGTLFAVREHNGSPALMCKAKESEQWVMSGVLAAVKDDAKTIGELQAVLDKAAQKYNWEPVENVPVENPTNAAEDVQQCAPTASNAPLSQSQSVNADAQQGGGDNPANPTHAAPVSPVDAGAATQSPSDAAPASLEVESELDVAMKGHSSEECQECGISSDKCRCKECLREGCRDYPGTAYCVIGNNVCPGRVMKETSIPGADGSTVFDYSGLDTTTVDTLHVAERIIRTARQKYIVDMAGAVSMVHGELVRNSDEHNNQHTEDTFIAWCRFMGISKTTAYQLLQVQSLISGATAEEQATLEAASPSLLYAAAKPSAPAELVQAVKDGDITTHKQYQEALAEIKARDAKIQELLEMSEGADQRADAAEARAKKAEQERDAARDAQANLSAMANKFSKQRDAAEQRVENAEQRAEEAERRAQAAEEDAAKKGERIRELENIRPQTIEATVVERTRMPEMAEEDAAELTTNLAASVTTVQRSFFMAAAAMAPQVKARCANTLWDTVNELATLLAASANPSYEEEEATPFD